VSDDDQTPLSEAGMRELLDRSRSNSEALFPYIGGEELNSSPLQEPNRWVIDFGASTLETAEAKWPELLDIVRTHVRPYRSKLKRASYRERWWQHGERQ